MALVRVTSQIFNLFITEKKAIYIIEIVNLSLSIFYIFYTFTLFKLTAVIKQQIHI